MNSDAFVRKGTDFIGVGVVFRDHIGTVLAACSKRIPGCFSVDIAELLAIRGGLLLAKDCGMKVSIVESDSQNSCLNSSDPLELDEFIFLDVKSLLHLTNCGSCCFIP
ncbi:Ribonuclease H-like domain containing protein [Parasponia andersonii]|uniref:Ribonuclease H-like domain containing protein n=1 Tax=Parasponia andersonii TaxID=3476 RepID=A0A2P5D736_PARAD|nr:Ribonuclease H-like domain containing protein [Parasponia andersonii]